MLDALMTQANTPRRAARILVVEDEEGTARAIQRSLVQDGYDVPEYVTLASDFDRVFAGVDPDLVLLDIDLADGSGIDLASRIPAHVPFVFLSAQAGDAMLSLARARRPAGFVVKPFQRRQLTAAVEMALEMRRGGSDPRALEVTVVPEVAVLSDREREVLGLLLDHKRPPAIAKALFISQHTVRNHLKSIFSKMNVSSQQELLDRITRGDAASR
jgi:DNA-binding NarL/FixJ family response regulator